MTMAVFTWPPAAASRRSASAGPDLARGDHDAPRAVLQLGVGRLEVDHQVLVRLAEADHGRGGDGVQRRLGGRSRLQARGAGEHLGAGGDGDDDVGEAAQPALRRAGDEHRARALVAARPRARRARRASPTRRRCRSRGRLRRPRPPSWRPSSSRSSAPSTALKTAPSPPAMIPRIWSGSLPKVGGHSAASRMPSRPLVPAPMKKMRRPAPSARAASTAARVIERPSRAAAAMARRSSSRRRVTTFAIGMRSISRLRRLRLSVASPAQSGVFTCAGSRSRRGPARRRGRRPPPRRGSAPCGRAGWSCRPR